jgi:hypothetical protein
LAKKWASGAVTPITRRPGVQIAEVVDYAATGFDVGRPVSGNPLLVEPALAHAEECRGFRDTEFAAGVPRVFMLSPLLNTGAIQCSEEL